MNRKSTAVELTHTPTGTTVWCQDKRTPEQNYELALLNLRYEVDKIVNGSTSLATLYECSLAKKLEGIEKKEADLRKSEREDEENLRDQKINEFEIQKHHIIKTKNQLMHVLTGITVDINDNEAEANEKLRQLVAEKSIKA